MTFSLRLIVWCGLIAMTSASARAELVVSTDFENASAAIDGIDQDSGVIRFRPGGDSRRGWPCWWMFRVDGIEAGRTVTLSLAPSLGALPTATGAGNEGRPLDASWSRPPRAFYSTDGGATWQLTGPVEIVGERSNYRQRIDVTSALFAWGPPFTVGDAKKLVERIAAAHSFAKPIDLGPSREGRQVPGVVLRDGPAQAEERYGIWIQARQHAWESGGSWVGRGFIEWLVSDDPRAVALRQKAEIYFVPVMDVDSVATGNGGKGQHPQDHNRDWTAKPHFPEVAAAQRKIAELDRAGRFDLFIDLHNPGPRDVRPFFFASPDDILSPAGRKNLAAFLGAARSEIKGPLVLAPEPHTSGPAYSPLWKQISKNWVSTHARPHVVAVTLETSWNTPHSTAEGYQTVGRQLGLAIEAYFRTSPRDGAASAQ